MHNDISKYTTRDLLQLTGSDDGDLANRATCTLLKKWESGIDVSYLIDLIETEVVTDKLKAAYFLYEVAPRVDTVKDAVLGWGDDVLAECRRAFVGYIHSSGWYDENAARGLVNGIQDFDLRDRLKVIEWAIATTDERFEDFSRLLMSDATNEALQRGLKKRGIRALRIAHEIRRGVSVERIREAVPEEDGYTFDHLGAFEPHYRRQRKRRLKTTL